MTSSAMKSHVSYRTPVGANISQNTAAHVALESNCNDYYYF